jgi:DNA-binding NarL/FixJ family response regulator
MPLRILLADDHPMFVQGLRGILERERLEVVGEAADGRAAVRVAEKVKPDVAVLDLAMPLLNGIDAAREIKAVSPDTVTILLTSYSEEQYVIDALRAGISGYLLKTRAAEDLVRAIREVSRGTLYLSPGVSRDVLRAHLDGATAPSDPLSAREREVLQLIAEGKSMKEIAALLCISVKTVETHRMRLTGKLEIHDTASLVRYAIRRGMIRP